MLVLSRRSGEILLLTLDLATDPATPVGELFAGGAIEIVVLEAQNGRVKLGIAADKRINVSRPDGRRKTTPEDET